MQRPPEGTKATIDDFRRSNWHAAVDGSTNDGYSTLSQSFAAEARAAVEEGRFSEGKVLWLLADATSMMLNSKSINTPFKPWIVTPTGRSAVPEDFHEADVELLAQIADETSDPWLQGRVADLVWLLKKPRSPRHALMAIDAYRGVPLTLEAWLNDGRECWERAISLTLMLRTGAGSRLNDITTSIVNAFNEAIKVDGIHALWLSDVLFENGLARTESADIAPKLAYLGARFRTNQDFHKARSYFETAAKWFKRAGDAEKWTDTTVAVAEEWVTEATARMSSSKPSNAVAAIFYENAIQTYRTIPRQARERRRIQERISELHRLMSEAGRESLQEMGRVDAGPLDLTQIAEAAQNAVSASGITSKPTIEGHFKTDQWYTTLDELVLPYRLARWQVQFEYQHSILQDLIPVFSFLGRELSFED